MKDLLKVLSYEDMLNEIWALMIKGENNLSVEEEELLEVLSILVEKYEEKKYVLPKSSPIEVQTNERFT